MSDLARIARHWMRQTEIGRGIRLEAADLDLLNAIGVGELIAAKAAEEMREAAKERQAKRTPQR